jgi:peptide/nickel transport system permease protein
MTYAAPELQLQSKQRFRLLRKLARHRSFRIGFFIILVMVVAAILAPVITQYDPVAMRVRLRFRPPQALFPFGTDQFGRDIFTRVVYGARLSLWIGLSTALSAPCSVCCRHSIENSMRC